MASCFKQRAFQQHLFTEEQLNLILFILASVITLAVLDRDYALNHLQNGLNLLHLSGIYACGDCNAVGEAGSHTPLGVVVHPASRNIPMMMPSLIFA
jgi:hypothetical protein